MMSAVFRLEEEPIVFRAYEDGKVIVEKEVDYDTMLNLIYTMVSNTCSDVEKATRHKNTIRSTIYLFKPTAIQVKEKQ